MLYQQPEFKKAVKARWKDTFSTALQILLGKKKDSTGVLHSLDEYSSLYSASIKMDMIRWPDKTNNSSKADTGSTLAENISYLKTWIQTRYTWLNSQWK